MTSWKRSKLKRMAQVRITPQPDDEPGFIADVEKAINGILAENAPHELVLIKIDNWFGFKWMGFSGKVLGALGVWSFSLPGVPSNVNIPPFVPRRVKSQRRFKAPDYLETEAGNPIHKKQTSTRGLGRKAAVENPGVAFVWYSGNSNANGRAAFMAYVPRGDKYRPWYVALEKGDDWQVSKTLGTTPAAFLRLTGQSLETADLLTR
jgi:hypothetical protein